MSELLDPFVWLVGVVVAVVVGVILGLLGVPELQQRARTGVLNYLRARRARPVETGAERRYVPISATFAGKSSLSSPPTSRPPAAIAATATVSGSAEQQARPGGGIRAISSVSGGGKI